MTRRVLCFFLLALAARPAPAALDLSADALLRDHLWREVRSAPPERRARVGLVLSAGSMRGTAHAGVIKVLEEAGFPIDVVAGTSMGALMGALYAGGIGVDRLWAIAAGLKVDSGTNLSARNLLSLILFDKLLSSKKIERVVGANLGAKHFDEMKKPFACVAMDVYTGEAILFRDGVVAPAVRASMNLPGLFAPIEYRHRYLVDGGVVDYIPVDAAILLGAEWTIASVTENDYTAARPKNVLEALEQVIDIRGSFLSHEQRRRADFLIEPPVGDIPMLDDSRVAEAMEKGVIAAAKKLTAAKEGLILASIPKLAAGWAPPPTETKP